MPSFAGGSDSCDAISISVLSNSRRDNSRGGVPSH
jgi:hypothetical protein